MATIIRRSPDLLGGKYFCVGATNRFVVSSRDARKLVYVDSANFGSILSATPVAANPGAVCYTTNVVHCICEDGYLRKFTLSGDTLSAVDATVNAYTQVSTWIYTSGANFVCPWGWDGIQIMTHAGTAVLAQRTTGLARVTNAYLNGSYLYCFDGLGKGVVLTISGSTITLGEQFAVPAGTNVDCIGLVNSATLGIGANTNPQYITLNITDPLVPVWASRTTKTAAIGGIASDGPLISTGVSPLSSDAGVYSVNGGAEVISAILAIPSYHGDACNSSLVFDGNGTDPRYVCGGGVYGGNIIGKWSFNNTLVSSIGIDPVTPVFQNVNWAYKTVSGKVGIGANGSGIVCRSWINSTTQWTASGFTFSASIAQDGYGSTSGRITLSSGANGAGIVDTLDWTSSNLTLTVNGSVVYVIGKSPMPGNTVWYHLLLSIDLTGSGGATIYVNGVKVGVTYALANVCTTRKCMEMLMQTDGIGFNLAVFRNARIYTKAVTDTEALAIATEDLA